MKWFLRTPSAVRLNKSLSVSPVPVTKTYVNVSPTSGSDDVNVPIVVPVALFSANVLELKLIDVGASLRLFTNISKVSVYVLFPLSVTVTVMVYVFLLS